MRPRNHSWRGLTILEILVASGLLAIVLVTVMVLFGQILHNTKKNALLSAGLYFADSVIEQQVGNAQDVVQAAGGNNAVPGFPAAPIEGQGKLSTADVDPRTQFLYRVETERIDPGVAADPGQMWFVRVEVRWWSDTMDGDNPSRSGFGNLNVKRERLVYLTGRP